MTPTAASGTPAARRDSYPIGPPDVSHSIRRPGSPLATAKKAAAKAVARGPETGSAPCARASSTTPSVPFNPTFPPIPATGFTTKPMRRTRSRPQPAYLRLPRILCGRCGLSLHRGPFAPCAAEFCRWRHHRKVQQVSSAGNREEGPEGRGEADRRRQARGNSQLDDLKLAPRHGFHVPRVDAEVNPHRRNGQSGPQQEGRMAENPEQAVDECRDRSHPRGVTLRPGVPEC